MAEPQTTFADLDDAELCEAAALVDDLILKAAGASDEVRIMALERKLWEGFAEEFKPRAVKALAALNFLDGADPLSAADATRIERGMIAPFAGFEKALAPLVKATMSRVWQASQQQIADRLNGDLDRIEPGGSPHVKKARGDKVLQVKPSFDLVDQKAVDNMARTQVVWIGEHFKKDLSDKIKGLVSDEMLKGGLGRRDVAVKLRNMLQDDFGIGPDHIPSGWMGSEAHYFEGVAANVMTTARVHGAVRQMQEVGVSHYEIVNPLDEKTCDRCRFMDGKTFELKYAVNAVEALDGVQHPDDVRAIHPWPRDVKMLETAHAEGTLAQNFPLPTYHLRCRCTVDVAEDATFEIVPSAPAPVPAREPVPAGEAQADLLRFGNVKSVEPLGGGANASYIIDVERDGIMEEAVWKPSTGEEEDLRSNIEAGTYYKREAAASEVAKMLGVDDMVPTTVTRAIGSEVGSVQAWAREALGNPRVDVAFNTDAIQRARVFDFIIGNSDRHSGNMMWRVVRGKNIPVLIDHGLCFPDGIADRFIQPNQTTFEGKLSKKVREFIQNIDETALAQALLDADIEEGAVKHTLYRLRRLKKDPSFLDIEDDSPTGLYHWAGGVEQEMELAAKALGPASKQAKEEVDKLVEALLSAPE